MLKYDPPTATTTPVRQVTGLGFAFRNDFWW
jgi:hypothetical protein